MKTGSISGRSQAQTPSGTSSPQGTDAKPTSGASPAPDTTGLPTARLDARPDAEHEKHDKHGEHESFLVLDLGD